MIHDQIWIELNYVDKNYIYNSEKDHRKSNLEGLVDLRLQRYEVQSSVKVSVYVPGLRPRRAANIRNKFL